MSASEQEFERTALEALSAHQDKIITAGLRVMDAVCVAGCINLASRHPQNRGPSIRLAEAFVLRLANQLAGFDPVLGELCRRGMDPAYDVRVEPAPGPVAVGVGERQPFGVVGALDPVRVRDELAGLASWCVRNPDATVAVPSRLVVAIAELLAVPETQPSQEPEGKW